MKKPELYLDASVWIAGIRKAEGGSGKLLALGGTGKVGVLMSAAILHEVKRNLPRDLMSRFKAAFQDIRPVRVEIFYEAGQGFLPEISLR